MDTRIDSSGSGFVYKDKTFEGGEAQKFLKDNEVGLFKRFFLSRMYPTVEIPLTKSDGTIKKYHVDQRKLDSFVAKKSSTSSTFNQTQIQQHSRDASKLSESPRSNTLTVVVSTKTYSEEETNKILEEIIAKSDEEIKESDDKTLQTLSPHIKNFDSSSPIRSKYIDAFIKVSDALKKKANQ